MEETEAVFFGLSWPRWLRRGAAFAGAVLILAGGIEIWSGVRRQQKTQETVIADYEVRTEGTERVHLIPNGLYETEWLEAGQVCSVNLTDYVELTFSARAEISGDMTENTVEQKSGSRQENESGGQCETSSGVDQQIQITGQGSVRAVMTGYQMSGDSKKTVYEQIEVLREEKNAEVSLPAEQKTIDESVRSGQQAAAGAAQPGTGMLEMTLQIRPSDYLERAEAADRILGGSVSRSLFLVFEGSFAVSAGGKSVNEPFSCQMEIPLAAQGSFYEISPPQPDVKAGQITQTETRPLPVRGKRIAVGAAGIFAGAALIWFVLWMTREPDALELWERRMHGLLKKYGSQLFEVESLPETEGKSVIRLSRLDSLVQISEDLRCPVLYVADADGLPKQGHFLVSGDTVCYECVLEMPNAPLAEDEGPEGGI